MNHQVSTQGGIPGISLLIHATHLFSFHIIHPAVHARVHLWVHLRVLVGVFPQELVGLLVEDHLDLSAALQVADLLIQVLLIFLEMNILQDLSNKQE